MVNNSLSELHKRQTLIEEALYDVYAPQINKLNEEVQALREEVAKLKNEKQVQANQSKEA